MRLSLRAILAFLPGVALVMATAAFASTDGLPQPAATNALPMVLRDDEGRSSFAIQLQRSRADSGTFNFDIAAVGVYQGALTLRSCRRERGRSDADDCDDDAATFNQKTTAKFYPHGTGTGIPTTVDIVAVIDTEDDTGVVSFRTPTKVYELHAGEINIAAAQATARRALKALVARDWTTVYAMLAPEVKAGYSVSQFASALSSQSLPNITSAVPVGNGSVTRSSGFSYFEQPVTLVAKAAGGGTATKYTSSLLLVFEQGAWRLIGTDPPTPA